MRKIRIFANISLDGVIQSPGGPDEDPEFDFRHGGWAMKYYDAAMAEALAEAQGGRYDLMLGRGTYDVFAGYWPTIKDDPIADGLNAATKYVATHRPDSLGWGPVHALGADVAAGARAVKSQDGPDIVVWGIADFSTMLLEQGLADELVLLVYPVLLGKGKRLHGDSTDARELALISTRTLPSGVLLNSYRHMGPLRIPGT